MKVTIVYDNEIYANKPGIADHGFSCFIQTKNHSILFDTGTNGKILIENMKNLSINYESIDTIIISHEHYDHNGGLNKLIPLLSNPIIYRLDPTPTPLANSKQVKVTDAFQLTDNIQSTGRLKGSPVDEQSLIIKTTNGIFVLTGCSHQGLEQLLIEAENIGPVTGIMGGFHDFSDLPLLKKVKKIYPSHCTKFKNEIKKQYPRTSFDCGVGLSISLF